MRKLGMMRKTLNWLAFWLGRGGLRRSVGHGEAGRLRKLLIPGTAVFVAVSGVGGLANGYIWKKTHDAFFTDVTKVPPKQVAIVLGARVYTDGTPSVVLRDRLWMGLKLYEAGKVGKIIVSGDHMAKDYNEPGAMFQYLVSHGIPASDVFMDHAGFRTLDTMARAKAVFGVRSAVICTQRFHLGRSIYLAKIHGIDAVGLVSDRRRYRHHFINYSREFVARSFAILDVHLLHTRPRYLGDPIDLSADGRQTRDM